MLSDYEYAVEIYCRVFGVDSDNNDVHVKGTLDAIKTLTDFEQRVIEYYYRHGLSLSKVAKEIGHFGGNRAGQIKNKALRKLRHPSRSSKISVSKLIKRHEEQLAEIKKTLEERNNHIEKLYGNVNELLKGNPIEPEIMDTLAAEIEARQESVKQLDLPYGVIAKLLRANINTVDKLLSLETYDSLKEIRGYGKVTLAKLLSGMRELGYIEWADRMEANK